MSKNNYFLLNTFSSQAFKGNPTPICFLSSPFSVRKMHSIAIELNAPVTVYLLKKDEDNTFEIRYFTRIGEIPTCGHGTFGAAYILFKENGNANHLKFLTIEGVTIHASRENETTYIEYPQFQKTEFEYPSTLNEALGIKSFTSYFFCKELESLFILLESSEMIKCVCPNFNKLIQSTNKVKEVVIMSESESDAIDFILRSFCPWIGINEDPVTGSIHAILGPYWSKRLNKDVLIANQVSERGGEIIIKTLTDSVKIGGECTILIEGMLEI